MSSHAFHEEHDCLDASAELLANINRDNQGLLHLHSSWIHLGNRSLLHSPHSRLQTINCPYPSWAIFRTLPETSSNLAAYFLPHQCGNFHAVRLLHAGSAISILLSTRDSRRATKDNKEGMLLWATSNTIF